MVAHLKNLILQQLRQIGQYNVACVKNFSFNSFKNEQLTVPIERTNQESVYPWTGFGGLLHAVERGRGRGRGGVGREEVEREGGRGRKWRDGEGRRED